jgi:hypothetical protein
MHDFIRHFEEIMTEAPAEPFDYEMAWRIAEQRTEDAQAQCDLLLVENERLRKALIHRCVVLHVEVGCDDCRDIATLLEERKA